MLRLQGARDVPASMRAAVSQTSATAKMAERAIGGG